MEVWKSHLVGHDKAGYNFLYYWRQPRTQHSDACRVLPYISPCMWPIGSETNVQALVCGYVNLPGPYGLYSYIGYSEKYHGIAAEISMLTAIQNMTCDTGSTDEYLLFTSK